MTPPTPKTNEEMTEDFVRKFFDMLSHIEACLGASERIRLTNEVKALLKMKDDEAVLAVEIVSRNMEEAHKKEMIELVESVPLSKLKEDDGKELWDSGCGDECYTLLQDRLTEWKTKKLTQLQND